MGDNTVRPDWKDYDFRLRRIADARRRTKRLVRLLAGVVLLTVASYWLLGRTNENSDFPYHNFLPAYSTSRSETADISSRKWDKRQIQELLQEHPLMNRTAGPIPIQHNGRRYRLTTTLDPELQQFAVSKLNTTTSRFIGIVVMEPATGRILAMAGYDRENPASNPCVEAIFPAASIFKIITAAAAIEKCEMNGASSLSFTGGKYTLYKSQLKEATGRYSQKISLQDSFAQSVNPVFGQLGARFLGKTALEDFAASFGFHQDITFEIPWSPSEIVVLDEPFQLAEVASGFNRTTLISPLHGAMIASAVLNEGKMPEPFIVDRMIDESGNTVYRNSATVLSQPISPRSSRILEDMMARTIGAGTGRRMFQGHNRDSVLSRLDLGGKTGSIDNHTHDIRYDWFVGYGSDKQADETIVTSVVVAHEKFIGVRAGQYARMLIRDYFNRYFAQKQKPSRASAARADS